MNENFNDLVNKFGMPVLAIAGTTLTAILRGESRKLPLDIATHLLGHKLSNLTEFELVDKLKNVMPDNLNHDIFRVSKSAVKLALKATVDKYQMNNDNRKKIKKKIDEVCKQLENNILDEVTVKDIIKYDNNLSETGLKWSNIFLDELKDADVIFKDSNFEKNFQSYFHLYFGEYLKKDNAAFVAYEREVQKMTLDAINDLKGKNISDAIKESISQYIKEIPAIVANSEIQEEFAKELSNLKKYFQSKKIIIREIKSDKLLIEIPPNEIKEIGNNYDELKTIIDDKYYFEYNTRLYSVDELNQEIFDYLAGKIKYNQLFTKRIIEAIKDDCKEQNIYKYTNQLDWHTKSQYCSMGMNTIADNFIGIIGEQLDKLWAIGRESDAEEKYVRKCRYIVKRTLDLTIFALLAQLWDDVHNQKRTINTKITGGLFMNLEMPERFNLLCRLIDIYREQKADTDLFIDDVLRIADQFNKDSELYVTCTELDKLGNNPTILDCYFAEKYMTVFFEIFRFLVKYKLTSMKKIEYFNIKNIAEGYLHHYVNLNKGESQIGKRNFDDCPDTIKSLSTNAVLLYKGNDYKKNINLFPFVIDYNALMLEQLSQIAFFEEEGNTRNRLEYSYLNIDKNEELKYTGIVQQKGNKNVVFLTDNDMKVYNIDCVFDTFREIQNKLFETI